MLVIMRQNKRKLIIFLFFIAIFIPFIVRADDDISFINISMLDDNVSHYEGIRIINFFLPTCPHCIDEISILKQIDNNFTLTIFMLNVNAETDNQTLIDFQTTHSIPLEWVMGYSRDSAERLFEVAAVPTLVVLDDGGLVVDVFQGETSYSTLEVSIDNALNHRTELYNTEYTNGTNSTMFVIIGIASVVGLAILYFLFLSFTKKK